MMAGLEESVGAHTTHREIESGNLAVLSRPSARSAALFRTFCLLLQSAGNAIRRGESSSSIWKGLPVSRHHVISCRWPAGPGHLGLV